MNQLTIVPKQTKLIVKPKKRVGTYIEEDFVLKKDWGNWALENTKLDRAEIIYEAEKFYDYWINITTSKGKKVNWFATWRNWMRRANEYKARNTNSKDSMGFVERHTDQSWADGL